MKTVDAGAISTLAELLDLAKAEPILLTTAEGRELILAEVDDIDDEIEAMVSSRELMDLLEERSKEKERGGYTLAEVKKHLGLD